jgi:hypothetical protein
MATNIAVKPKTMRIKVDKMTGGLFVTISYPNRCLPKHSHWLEKNIMEIQLSGDSRLEIIGEAEINLPSYMHVLDGETIQTILRCDDKEHYVIAAGTAPDGHVEMLLGSGEFKRLTTGREKQVLCRPSTTGSHLLLVNMLEMAGKSEPVRELVKRARDMGLVVKL